MNFTGTYPTQEEVERIRLLLSTYQDGTGQYVLGGVTQDSLPGWRDFERATAVAMNGQAQESKSFFDVVVPRGGSKFGVSCKMRAELRSVLRRGIIYVEVSNAAGDFWGAVRNAGMNSGQEMQDRPADAGKAILDLVASWHHQPGVDLSKSYYLVCQYRTKPTLEYQIFQLPLDLPDPATLTWKVRVGTSKDGTPTHTLIGEAEGRAQIEWYADSGGQLKYYPSVDKAIWQSEIFSLEPLPDAEDGYSIMNKAKAYFPEKWQAVIL